MSIPVEILADVLSRLPVQTLLRFRSVSPPWRDLIDSPHFVKLHLNRSIQTETNLTLIFNKPGLQIAKFQPLDLSVQVTTLDHHPLKPFENRTQVWGSCNGLLCLSARNVVVLWNPSTREHVKLPQVKFKTLDESIYRTSCGFGFGYDSYKDDYKVVMVVDLVNTSDYASVVGYEVHVYSIKSNTWRKAEDFYYLPYMRREPGKFAAGALHWTMSKEVNTVGEIVAIDLGTEKTRIVPGPKLMMDMPCMTTLDCFQETISLVADYFLGYLDVWVMKEYGVENSWIKLFSFVDNRSRPIFCSKSSEQVLMQHNGGLVWFDAKNSEDWHETVNDKECKNIKHIAIKGAREFMRAEICVESLVPLRGSRKVTDKKKPEAKRRNDMRAFLSEGFELVL